MIYHITTEEAWEAQKDLPHYENPSLTSEGFIHASDINQLEATLKRFFEGATGLLILKINALKLTSELKYEKASDGTGIFPHIYGHINKSAVIGQVHLLSASEFELAMIEE